MYFFNIIVMSQINWNKFQYIDYFDVKKNEVDNLPKGVAISTMCASCKLGTCINIDNVEKYFPLNSNDILTVKRNALKVRTLIPEKIKKRRAKKNKTKKNVKTNYFFNQVTVVVRIDNGSYKNLNDVPKINIKLFKNGSIQMSGVKRIGYANTVLNKLIYRLNQIKAKIGNSEIKEIKEIKFIEDSAKLNVYGFKIDMINSNYKVNMIVDRDKLYLLLLKKKIKASYEKCISACVIIKYTPKKDNDEEKEISIFVFQKGNIIITGARKKSHIISSYNYINDILLEHGDDINKKDETEEEKLLLSLYKDILKENSHKLEELNITCE